ncbi:hypothetical protein NDU88_000444 [Pleurodeles waltl]|uniref:Uncharacterized protein n=1 Tax=Pleurodeles waltl TaxID=8319 RepID=A0AAV7V540_PLEWA|nr:hypothetical protein NDU88_000444 [Pleurodeles waltl]
MRETSNYTSAQIMMTPRCRASAPAPCVLTKAGSACLGPLPLSVAPSPTRKSNEGLDYSVANREKPDFILGRYA